MGSCPSCRNLQFLNLCPKQISSDTPLESRISIPDADNTPRIKICFKINLFPLVLQDLKISNVKFHIFEDTLPTTYKEFEKIIYEEMISYSIHQGNTYYAIKNPLCGKAFEENEIFGELVKRLKINSTNISFYEINIHQEFAHYRLDEFVQHALVKNLEKIRKFGDEKFRNYYIKKMAFGLTYTSNKIEGNTLTKNEAKNVVNNNNEATNNQIDMVDKTRDKKEMFNHYKYTVELIELLYKKDVEKGFNLSYINEELLFQIHRRIMYQGTHLKEDQIGKYRNVSVYIGTGSVVNYSPPAPEEVSKRMEEYFNWLHQQEDRTDIIRLAAEAHVKFEQIHPFVDGNGRVGRLIINCILLLKKYPLCLIYHKAKRIYIQSLKDVDSLNNYDLLTRIIAESCYGSILVYLKKFKQYRKRNSKKKDKTKTDDDNHDPSSIDL